MSWLRECQTEQYFSRDNAMARSTASAGTAPSRSNREIDLHEPMRFLLSTVGGQVRAKAANVVTPFRQDEDDVGRHAAGQRKGQRLHGGRSGGTVAVNRHRRRARHARKFQLADPGELGDGRRLGHARILPDLDLCGTQRRAARRAASCHQEPPERQNHEQVGQHVAEGAVGPPRLGGRMDDLAVRQIALLGHLVDTLK